MPSRISHVIRSLRNSPTLLHEVNKRRSSVLSLESQLLTSGKPMVNFMPVSFNVYAGMSVIELEQEIYRHSMQLENVNALASFWWLSRKIFEFDSALAEALHTTSLHEVPCDALQYPANEFYIGWGDVGQKRMPMRGGECILDGAYVLIRPDNAGSIFSSRMTVRFSTQRLSGPAQGVEQTVTYHIALDGSLLLTEAIAKGEIEHIKTIEHLDNMSLQMATNAARQYGLRIEASAGARIHRTMWDHHAPFIREVLPLLFNCVAYLTSYRDNVSEEFSSDAPMSVKLACRQAINDAERKAAANNAARKGYSVVNFVCDPTLPPSGVNNSSGRTVAAHWRRGHWRMQRFGVGLEKTKLLWIMPVLVSPTGNGPGVDHGQVSNVQ